MWTIVEEHILIQNMHAFHCMKYRNFTSFFSCGNFVETQSFETLQKLCVSINFHTRKLGEISVFYAVFVEYSLKASSKQLFPTNCDEFYQVGPRESISLQW